MIRTRRRHPSSRAGFTLIELIAVMIVIAIMAAVVAPSFTSASEAQGGVGVRLLATDLAHARQRAAASGQATWVTISVANDQWSLLTDDPASPGFANAITLEKASGVGPWVVDPGVMAMPDVDITAATFDGAPSVGFDWLGKPLATTGAALATDGSVSFSGGQIITVDAESGVVSTP